MCGYTKPPKISREVVATLALLALMCAVCATGNPTLSEPPEFLPLGELQVVPQDAEYQSQMLRAFATKLRYVEGLQGQGDVNIQLTITRTALQYANLTAFAATLPNGKITVPSLEKYGTPEKTERRWAFSGVKQRNDFRIVRPPEEALTPHDQEVVVYDGVASTCWYPIQKIARISSLQEAAIIKAYEPWLTLTSLAGNKPISEVVGSSGARYDGMQTVGDDKCYKVSVAAGNLKREIWLSASAGWRAKRVTESQGNSNGTDLYGVTEVDTYRDCGDGLYFPLSGKYVEFLRQSDGQKERDISYVWSTVSYSGIAADSVFAPVLPIGTKVTDFTFAPLMTYTVGE